MKIRIRLACSLALIFCMSAGCSDSSPAPEFERAIATSSAPSTEFSGTFLFAHNPGQPGFEVTLEPDGKAWSSANGPGTKTLGRWRLINGGALIEWDDGWKNGLARTADGWTQRSWAPGMPVTDPPIKTVPATKLR